ncbi:MAG: phenylalanine--tRNA ligase subunit beta, partial [Phycisphaeraceae bacterium]|nr:phenylalanine--tRNA ligase subunit beta [Phycisphaeraceae bacterium]
MRTSINWLNDYLDPPLDAATQADLLTAAGFPFDGEDVAENGEPWQEIETTSNRGDCLCHLGLAREAALLGGSSLKAPRSDLPSGGPPVADVVEIRNLDPDRCPLYTARVIRGVKVGPSPDWLQRRLVAIGLVPRNNLVDATNFVLFEYGQPTHVFDLSTVRGDRIEIRPARDAEPFLPIGEDAKPLELTSDDLVIADA